VITEHVICEEKHEDGNPHVHAFIKYSKKVMWTETRWDIGGYHGNYQVAKSWKAVERYCKKGGNYISNIDVEAAKNHKTKNASLLKEDPKELVDEGVITLFQLPALLKAKAAYKLLEAAKDMEIVRGIWVWGKPGLGKSYLVRTNEKDLYIKAQNKWWDGY